MDGFELSENNKNYEGRSCALCFEMYSSELIQEVSSTSSNEKEPTNWRLIIVTGIVSCLISVENSVLGMGEWPYMKEV